MAMLLAIAPSAVADGLCLVDIDDITYYLYYTGDIENAVGSYAVCSGPPYYVDYKNTTAIIRSSVSCKLEWEDSEYNEALGEWISVPHSRLITAPVTKIGDLAFEFCESLTSVSIPNTVTNIGSTAFSGCSSLTRVNIPSSVTEIGDGAFSYCSSLVNVNIFGSITYIGSATFSCCSSLTSMTIPNSVTEIRYGAFYNCTSLTSVNIPSSVIEISDKAFDYCTSLTSVNIPSSVTVIGSRAFEGCTSLTSVNIPNSVTNIGYYTFKDCISLKDIYSRIENPAGVSGYQVFNKVPKQSCVLHVPPGTEELYRNADEWKYFFIMGSYEMKTAYSKGFASSVEFLINEPKGVTADGASRMYIYFDEDISSVKSVTKKIKINGQEVTDPAIIGKFGEFKELPWTLGNGKYGFDYCAPEDFPADFFLQNKYEISLEVVVIDNNNKERRGYKTFTVMRPGVLLLHGLLGDDGAFEAQYRHLITVGGYESCQVWNANYKESNTAPFQENVEVVGDCLTQICGALAEQGIISSKYDLVGHSMGGILSRLYAQEVNPNAVNRIITLDTPHYGSQLANARPIIRDILVANVFLGNVVTATVCAKLLYEISKSKYDAFKDLAPSSQAISALNNQSCSGIPIHAIGSYMHLDQTQTTHPASEWDRYCYTHYSTLLVDCATLFPESIGMEESFETSDFDFEILKLMYGGPNDVYEGKNDGIVSLTSQLGGLASCNCTMLDSLYVGFCGANSNAHHTKTHHWDVTIDAIKGLLTRPKTDPCFSTSGFRAPVNTLLASGGLSLVSLPELKDAPETSFINLTLEKNEDEYNRDLVATMATSDDIESFIIFACLDDDKFLVSACDTELTFVIPDNYEGNLVFYALGRTANDELVADMDSVEYTSITSLVALDFEDYDNLTMCVGQTLGLNVVATWDNGESEYVKPTYSATPGGILSIDGQMFTPVAVGECELIAEYKGLTCTKKITVYPGSVPVNSRYDVNLDGEVNIADINAVINIILMDASSGMNGDVNDDGEVNIADVNAILNAILSY